jgi:DNA-binding NarL/FixJ family response regulator
MMSPVRILLADDHALVRAGISALLQQLDGVEVVAEVEDGHAVLAQVAALRPDIVLMDIAMPGLSGLEATAQITRDFPSVRVLILSVYDDAAHVRRALEVGAAGYILKAADAAGLALAIAALRRGEPYLSPRILRNLIDAGDASAPDAPSLDRLTPRQRQTLLLLAEGYSMKEIAQFLGVSVKTVETYRAQLMQRLGIRNLAGLIRFAIQVGLISPEFSPEA